MAIFEAVSNFFGSPEQMPLRAGTQGGSETLGNAMGLRPELPHIAANFRAYKNHVEKKLGSAYTPPADISVTELDAARYANTLEAEMHSRRMEWLGFQADSINRETAQFERQLEIGTKTEALAHQVQGDVVKYIDLKAQNAVTASSHEHVLAARLKAHRHHINNIQGLVTSSGLV